MPEIDFDNENLFAFDEGFFNLMYIHGFKKRMVEDVKRAIEVNREFCLSYLRPMSLEVDRKFYENPDYLPWEMVELAARHRRLTNYIPKFMGGSGEPMAIIGPVAEELAATDCAFVGLLGGHGLGLVSLMFTFNIKVIDEVITKIVEGERTMNPVMLSCAITEPTAGSDVEEEELYPVAHLVCQAKRVDGGALLNGRKVFISTGHAAKYHVVIMPFDLKRPLETFSVFLVPGDSRGFSLGRKEHKMGQKAGLASELVFEDCFVPEEHIVLTADDKFGRMFPDQGPKMLRGVLGVTRAYVGAWSTGTARGVTEHAIKFAKTHKLKGKTMINHQWVQAHLTNMVMNVLMARAIYMESYFTNLTNMKMGFDTLPRFMNTDIMAWLMQTRPYKKILHADLTRKVFMQNFAGSRKRQDQRVQYMASMAKVVGSDVAMENSHLALELAGEAGVRHDRGMEKYFRDSKLLQIFEGTNQLNRLNIFNNYIGRHVPGVEVY
jgi:acyl-CoA dehydrogenase